MNQEQCRAITGQLSEDDLKSHIETLTDDTKWRNTILTQTRVSDLTAFCNPKPKTEPGASAVQR